MRGLKRQKSIKSNKKYFTPWVLNGAHKPRPDVWCLIYIFLFIICLMFLFIYVVGCFVCFYFCFVSTFWLTWRKMALHALNILLVIKRKRKRRQITKREKSLKNAEGIPKLLWKSCFNLQLLVFKYTVFFYENKTKTEKEYSNTLCNKAIFLWMVPWPLCDFFFF